ncbi:MAG TPA: hypothetical protein VND44_01195 [Acidimicrobiales bacterium]|nr:hypothetical protein [Acidimicrobiales bacterium]
MDRRSGHGGIGTRAAVGFGVGCLCLLAGTGVSACGTPASSATSTAPGVNAGPLARIRASVGVTEAAGTAHFVTASTVQQVARSNPGGVQRSAGTGDVRFAGPDIETVTATVRPTSPQTPSTKVLRIGNSVYDYVSTPSGDRWTRSNISARNVNYLGAVAPSSLADANGPVTVVGTSSVDGRPAVEYGVPTPGTTSSPSVSGLVEEHITVAPFVAHVWLDATGRIVRTSASLSTTVTPAPGGSGPAVPSSSYTSTLTVTLSDFGEPVHLSRPPVSDQG